jgi:macrolide transport system ATP-binding/permease protein
METLQSLNRDQGVTIVLVTHELDIAAYASRTVTMRDGRIISDQCTRPSSRGQPASSQPAAADMSLFHPKRRGDLSATPTAAYWAFCVMIMAAAAQAIFRNKMRSALTMLGVFIGVAALIAMVAVGQGANDAVRKQIESLGTNLLVVLPGAATTGGVRAGSGSASTLRVGDALAIRRKASAVGSVSYLIRQLGQVQYGNQNWTTNIQGVSYNCPPVTNWHIALGQAITSDDEDRAALVVVLGQAVAQGPIDARNRPGRPVMISFTTAERKVIGVAAPSQQQAPLNWPYPPPPNPYNLQPRLAGFVNQIFVQAVDANEVRAAIAQVTEILSRRHRIRPGDINDFLVRNLSQIAETAEGSSRIMAILLAAVASISLVVGGIGIMNILLVSVTERTREIGLRMAIGARRAHVLFQFLAEAVFLSVSGGIAGIVMGTLFSITISLVTGWPAPISLAAIAGVFIFSAAVGIFFGASIRRARPPASIRSRRCATSRPDAELTAVEYWLCENVQPGVIRVERMPVRASPKTVAADVASSRGRLCFAAGRTDSRELIRGHRLLREFEFAHAIEESRARH